MSETGSKASNLKNLDFIGMRPDEFLAILGSAVKGYSLGSIPVPTQIVAGLGTGGLVKQRGVEEPYWFADPKFSHLRVLDTYQNAAESSDGGASPISPSVLLRDAPSIAEATDIVSNALASRLAKQLTIAIEYLDTTQPINTHGVDSLVAVELRNWIFKELGVDLSVFDILKNEPLRRLAETIASGLKFLNQQLRKDQGSGEDGKLGGVKFDSDRKDAGRFKASYSDLDNDDASAAFITR